MQQPTASGSRPTMDSESQSATTSVMPQEGQGVGMGVAGAVVMGTGGSTRRTSRVWRYFGMVDNCHYICRLCSFVGAYTNTTNMRKHIQHHHPERFQDILDHTRPTTRPYYTHSGSIPRPRPPLHYVQQGPPQHYAPAGIIYQPQFPPKRVLLPKPPDPSYLHGDSPMTAPQCSVPQTSISAPVAVASSCQQVPQGLSYPSMSQSSQPPTVVALCDLSPDETKLMSQLLPPLPDATDSSEGSQTPSRALPTGDDRGGGGGSSEVSQNNCDDVGSMVVSASPPEHFLAEIGERDPSPTPPTPTHQKPESYQLRHNNHLTLVLEALAQDESFMDVTLTAQGRSLKAHKSVLSAVSPYFRGVLRDNPCQHPIIIMPRDVRFEELYSIVNYIYKGEMTVAAEDLTSLLKTAEILQVSGLAPSDTSATLNPQHESSTTTTTHPRSSSTSSSASSTAVPPRSARSTKPRTTPPVRPKSRDSSINPSDFIDIDMTCVKEEVTSGGEEDDGEEQMPKGSNPRSPGSQQQPQHQQQQHSDPLHQQTLPTFSPTYNQGLQQSLPSTSSDQGFQNVAASASSSQSTDSSLGIKTDPDTDVNQGMCAMETPTPLVCPHCEERHREVDSLLTHLRLRHPTKPSFTCGCGRVFTRQTYQQAHSKVCPNAS